ncbi:hypothetical protein SAMD00019534_041970 [Acytostelium subglobosum LB1]|uniref:hypothetical protein n=1 Tax=Acytostelium subglobosum LB1 TaxID=1410327 RepID=UPI0006450B49|nr:hypothetical protein SAMD00019534_041970 [Acytostelium subglobosum LB1]GAM21022.1 hypothetical protein SAMD00019534_041970 [Acytostelium subglobosum LB1]|eukprot:XP_012756156.1 hypothetical protein SAMD00019534_041970 [Acytostelium subglobosum LB1]
MGYRGRGPPKTTASMYKLSYNTKREYKYIKDILRTLSGTGVVTKSLRIDAMAKEALVSFIRDIARRIIDLSRDLLIRSGKATLQARDIQMAVRIELRGELAKHAIVQGMTTLAKANPSYNAGDAEFKPPAKNAGLIVKPSYVRKQLKIAGFGRVAKMASVYFAAVLEYVLSEVLELSSNNAQSCGKTTITSQHIFFAVSNDAELNSLCEHVTFPSAGVASNIHAGLVSKKSKKFNPSLKIAASPADFGITF